MKSFYSSRKNIYRNKSNQKEKKNFFCQKEVCDLPGCNVFTEATAPELYMLQISNVVQCIS